MRYARAVAKHSTDGLTIGRKAMQMFWAMPCAASVLNSSVTFLMVAPTATSFQPARESACLVSTFCREPQRKRNRSGHAT